MSSRYDAVVMGGRIVGLATAMALEERGVGSIAVLEAESRLAGHQTRQNSGVLGVHFTRTVEGRVEAGPNAVLAWRREGYRRSDFSLRDTVSLLGYGGFWHMAAKQWRTGIAEMRRSLSKALFVRDLQKLVPAVQMADLIPGKRGVRAQAVASNGKLLDDFHVIDAARSVHLLNAPPSAATSSLDIGRHLAERVLQSIG